MSALLLPGVAVVVAFVLAVLAWRGRAILGSARCRRCGHDVRDIARDRACPECGRDLAPRRAVRPARRRRRDAAWLASIALAAALAWLAVVATPIARSTTRAEFLAAMPTWYLEQVELRRPDPPAVEEAVAELGRRAKTIDADTLARLAREGIRRRLARVPPDPFSPARPAPTWAPSWDIVIAEAAWRDLLADDDLADLVLSSIRISIEPEARPLSREDDRTVIRPGVRPIWIAPREILTTRLAAGAWIIVRDPATTRVSSAQHHLRIGAGSQIDPSLERRDLTTALSDAGEAVVPIAIDVFARRRTGAGDDARLLRTVRADHTLRLAAIDRADARTVDLENAFANAARTRTARSTSGALAEITFDDLVPGVRWYPRGALVTAPSRADWRRETLDVTGSSTGARRLFAHASPTPTASPPAEDDAIPDDARLRFACAGLVVDDPALIATIVPEGEPVPEPPLWIRDLEIDVTLEIDTIAEIVRRVAQQDESKRSDGGPRRR